MGMLFGADMAAHPFFRSVCFERSTSAISRGAFALIDVNGKVSNRLGIMTAEPKLAGDVEAFDNLRLHIARSEAIESVSSALRSQDEIGDLAGSLLPEGFAELGCAWLDIELDFASGGRDRVLLSLDAAHSSETAFVVRYIHSLWPVLREDCLRDILGSRASDTDSVLGWAAANLLDASIFVLNSAGRMLRLNMAGRQLLEEGSVLRRSPRGLVADNDADTRKFRAAVAECAAAPDPTYQHTLLIERAGDGLRVPVTLSRYIHDGRASALVVAMIPTPPERDRVEALARQHGLTMTEARVATLMQLGLSNRTAAQEAGLKEQTFNTYAKRVLSKLNVSGRAEMAQLLTWQSAGRRVS